MLGSPNSTFAFDYECGYATLEATFRRREQRQFRDVLVSDVNFSVGVSRPHDLCAHDGCSVEACAIQVDLQRERT